MRRLWLIVQHGKIDRERQHSSLDADATGKAMRALYP
jgi:hypothetical protein